MALRKSLTRVVHPVTDILRVWCIHDLFLGVHPCMVWSESSAKCSRTRLTYLWRSSARNGLSEVATSDSTTDIPQPLKCPGTIAPPLFSSTRIFTDLRTAWRLHDSLHAHDLLDALNALLLVTSGLAIDHASYDMDPHDTTNNPPAGPAPSEHSSTTPHATRRQRIRLSIARHIHALRSTLFQRPHPSHNFIATNDNPAHATARPGRTDDILDAIERHRETTEQGFNRIADVIAQAALGLAGHGGGPGGFPPGIAPDPPEVHDHQPYASFTNQEASTPTDDMLNFPNPDLDGQPSRPLVRLLRPVSPSHEIRPSNDPRSPRVSRDYDTSGDDETMQAAESGRRSQGERVSCELAESGAGPSHAPLNNPSQAHELAGDGQRDDAREATSREQQAIAAPQEDNAPQASSSQEHHGIGDSSNAPGATSGEGDSAFVLSTHDRDTLNDILAHPEAYQINVEFQLPADSPKDDLYPQLAPSPDSLHSALYAPLSCTIPLPALEEQGPDVAPAQSGPVASSSGNADAAQTTSAPLAFPSLETSSTHSESSALLHYSHAAGAETRRYDEGSARRELAAMMSDPSRRAASQGVEEGQQQQQQQRSIASSAVPASHGEAPQASSPAQEETSPDDNLEHSSDVADKDPARAARDVSEENPDSTYIHYRDFVVTDGVLLGRRLLVSVGKKLQLQAPYEPFDEGLRSLLGVCKARQHDLTQLYVELYQVRVSGGQHDDQDALDTILIALRFYLRTFNTAVILFKATDDVQATQAVEQARGSIAVDFSHLHHVRIEGMASAARLLAFPMEELCILEALFHISEKDMLNLLKKCSDRLAFLAAGPIDPFQENGLSSLTHSSRARPAADKRRTFVIRVNSAFPCERILKRVPGNAVVHFSLTDTRGLDKLRPIVEAHPTWTMRLD
ncbi:hypothetical protein K523DRAFT_372817 [Schizophyllum commune Tattone D]|nr:hypothetical protein K523DRAFT_372817 [Schizophyllum commune Tattone D]